MYLSLKVIFILRHCSNIPSNTRCTRYINKIWVQVCFGACFKRKLSNTFNCLKDLKFFMHSWRQRDKNICNSDLTNIHVSTKGILLLKYKLSKQQNFPRSKLCWYTDFQNLNIVIFFIYQKAVLSHYFIVRTIS